VKTGLGLKDLKRQIIQKQKQRQWDAALESIYEARDLFPNEPFFIKSEVYVLERTGRLKEAVSLAERHFHRLQKDSFFLKTYIRLLRKLNQREDLVNLIDTLLEDSTKRDRQFLEFLYETIISTGQKDLLEKFQRLHPDISANTSKTQTYAMIKSHYKGMPPEEAIQEIEALRLLPEYRDDYNLNLFLADLYRRTGKLNEAVTLYESLLAERQDLYVRKMLGFTLIKTNQSERAISYLRDAFLEDPSDHFVYQSLLSLYKKTSRLREAEETLLDALSRHSDKKHLHGLLKKVKRWQQNS
jgi:predicted Zn-dependent protease